jgi:hypothetical protein
MRKYRMRRRERSQARSKSKDNKEASKSGEYVAWMKSIKLTQLLLKYQRKMKTV